MAARLEAALRRPGLRVAPVPDDRRLGPAGGAAPRANHRARDPAGRAAADRLRRPGGRVLLRPDPDGGGRAGPTSGSVPLWAGAGGAARGPGSQVRARMTGREADALARDVIAARGFGEAFGHSLGHGLGLEVHEAPRLSQTNEMALPLHAVVTIEPGIYLPGWGGVRLEDDVLPAARRAASCCRMVAPNCSNGPLRAVPSPEDAVDARGDEATGDAAQDDAGHQVHRAQGREAPGRPAARGARDRLDRGQGLLRDRRWSSPARARAGGATAAGVPCPGAGAPAPRSPCRRRSTRRRTPPPSGRPAVGAQGNQVADGGDLLPGAGARRRAYVQGRRRG